MFEILCKPFEEGPGYGNYQPTQMIFCRCALMLGQHTKGWVGGGKGRVGWEWGGRWKTLDEEIQHHKCSTDGPNHTTRLRMNYSGHGNYSRGITPNWYTPQVPLSRSWFYRVINPPADNLNLDTEDTAYGYLLNIATRISWAMTCVIVLIQINRSNSKSCASYNCSN